MTRGGTRTSAGGQVTGSARIKALGEALDPMVADLKGQNEGADGKRKTQRNTTPKPKTTVDTESKKLQKDMKAFLIWF